MTVGGTRGEAPHYGCTAGVASVSLPREGLVSGEQGGKEGERTLETLLMLPMKMFSFQGTFFYNALEFTCLVICSADG